MTVQQRATLDDVARLAGVSSKTVSRVFTQPRPRRPRDRRARARGRQAAAVPAEHAGAESSPRRRARTPSASSWASWATRSTTRSPPGSSASSRPAASRSSSPRPTTPPRARSGSPTRCSRSASARCCSSPSPTTSPISRASAISARRSSPSTGRRATSSPTRSCSRTTGASSTRPPGCSRAGIGASATSATRHPSTPSPSACAATATRSPPHGIPDTARWERLVDDPERRRRTRLVGDLLRRTTPRRPLITGNNRVTVGALRVLRDRHDDGRTALIGFDDFDTADVLGVTVISLRPRRARPSRRRRSRSSASATPRASRGRSSCPPGSSSGAPASAAPPEGDRMTGAFVQLEAHGVGLVLETPATRAAAGAALGRASSGRSPDAELQALAHGVSRQTAPGTLDAAWQLSLSPQEGDGWTRPPRHAAAPAAGCCTTPRWSRPRVDAEAPRGASSRRATRHPVSCSRPASRSRPGGVVWVEHALRHDGERRTPRRSRSTGSSRRCRCRRRPTTLTDVRRPVDAREAPGDDRDAAGLDRAAVTPGPRRVTTAP